MTEKDIFLELEPLMLHWIGREYERVPAETITQLFNIHNRIFQDRPEYSKSCGGCRQRVWSKLVTWYDIKKGEYATKKED